jgi:hypothetical protein
MLGFTCSSSVISHGLSFGRTGQSLAFANETWLACQPLPV